MQRKRLTVSVYSVNSSNLSVWQDHDMKADTHLAEQPPVSLNSHEVFSILSQPITLVPLTSPCPSLRAVARWGIGLSQSALHCDVGGRSDQWESGRRPTLDQESTDEQRKQGHLDRLPPQTNLFVKKTNKLLNRSLTSSLSSLK